MTDAVPSVQVEERMRLKGRNLRHEYHDRKLGKCKYASFWLAHSFHANASRSTFASLHKCQDSIPFPNEKKTSLNALLKRDFSNSTHHRGKSWSRMQKNCKLHVKGYWKMAHVFGLKIKCLKKNSAEDCTSNLE